jgi:hypothetical protein
MARDPRRAITTEELESATGCSRRAGCTSATISAGRSAMAASGSRQPVLLVDTSVAVPYYEHHLAVFDALYGRRRGLAGHAVFETFSVLTRGPSAPDGLDDRETAGGELPSSSSAASSSIEPLRLTPLNLRRPG